MAFLRVARVCQGLELETSDALKTAHAFGPEITKGRELNLTALPEAVGQLTALRELHLRNTKVEYLPETMATLVELRQIDLRGTLLKSLPQVLATLPRLEKVDLRWVNTLDAPEWLADLEARGCVVYR